MLARFAETITSWASRGKKLLWEPTKARYASYRTGAGEDVTEVAPDHAADGGDPTTIDAAGEATGDHETAERPGDEPTDEGRGVGVSSTPEEAEPGNDPLEGIRNELHRDIEAGIEQIMSLFPATGENSDAQDVLDSVRRAATSNVPQPPTAAQAVLSLCQRPDYSLHELTQLIERDPSLSAALLRHANSTWYAGSTSGPVLGLRAAVHLVGATGVHASVMSRIVEGAMSRPGPKFATPARMVWHHMIRVAPIAREVASLFGVDTDAAFSLGLLHDVGKLVLFHHISDRRRARCREITLSEKFLGLALASLHEPLGGLAVLEWGLDEKAAHVVASHHRDPKPEPEDVLTEVIFLAERIDIAEQHGQTLDLEPLWEAVELTGPLPRVKNFVKARIEADFSSPVLEAEESQPIDEPILEESVPAESEPA